MLNFGLFITLFLVNLHCLVPAADYRHLLLNLVVFLYVRPALVYCLLYQLHRFVGISGRRTEILLLVYDAMADRTAKLFQHLKFDIFQVLLLKSLILICFEFDRTFEMLDWCVVAKETWNLFGPVVAWDFLLLFPWLGFGAVLVSVSEGTAHDHVLLSLLLLGVPPHAVARTLVVSYSAFIQVVCLEIFILGLFVACSFSGILEFLGGVAAVVGSSTIGSFEAR